MAKIVLVVEPIGHGGRFRARLDGRLIVASSRQPFLDAARVLIVEGCDPASRLAMRHTGSATDALIAKVGAAARLAVDESGGPPKFVPWKASPYQAGSPQIAQIDRQVAEQPPEPERASGAARSGTEPAVELGGGR
jgi:hypothetical protein